MMLGESLRIKVFGECFSKLLSICQVLRHDSDVTDLPTVCWPLLFRTVHGELLTICEHKFIGIELIGTEKQDTRVKELITCSGS